jgi:starvation-inducible DNA-binding protein
VSKVRAIDTRGKAAAPLDTPTDLSAEAVREISEHLNAILATTFALYLKTKNFHWHVSGPHFRDYHLLLDEQSEQIFASTDDIAERVRKIGGMTLRSIGQISKLQGIEDNDEDYVTPGHMLAELVADNKTVVAAMRECHEVCDKYGDVATASILEKFHRSDRTAGLVHVRGQPQGRRIRSLSSDGNATSSDFAIREVCIPGIAALSRTISTR